MPQNEHNDWPSFETVLRDVAPDSPTVRSLTSADRRAKYAETAAAIRANQAAAPSESLASSPVDSTSPTSTTDSDHSGDSIVSRSTSPADTDLPAPLPPLEIDTSSIKALIEPQGGSDLDTSAFDALAPLPEFDVELDDHANDGDLLSPAPLGENDSALDLFVDDSSMDDVATDSGDESSDDGRVEEETVLALHSQDVELALLETSALESEEDDEPHSELETTLDKTFVDETVLEAPNEDQAAESEDSTRDEAVHDDEVAELFALADDIDVDSAVPAFDPSTDGVEFGSSTPWDTSANFGSLGEDSSLVFELDDSTITEVDAAYASDDFANPTELDDPFFDAPGNVEAQSADDDGVFSPADVPDLPTSTLDTSLLDDPFQGVSTDLSTNDAPAEPINDNFGDTTKSSEYWELAIDEPEQVVDVADLEVDDLGSIEIPEAVELIEPLVEQQDHDAQLFEIPDVTSISYDGADSQIELPDTSFTPETFDDLATQLDGDSIDLSDLNDEHRPLDPEQIDQRKADLFDFSSESESTIQLPNDTVEFDSVAAAEEIESHLDSLMSFEDGIGDAAVDNVIPLRPDVDLTHATDSVEPIADVPEEPVATAGEDHNPNNTGWVSLPPEVKSKSPDPWAHMRPTEEPKKKGFWANRPKFFGGQDRKRARAERDKPAAISVFDDNVVGISYDKACPNCADECKVDLDDPIGRRVHVSCPSCGHMWHTPYILEESQAG